MLSSENMHSANDQAVDKSKKPLGPRPYPLKGHLNEPKSSTESHELPTNSHHSSPPMGPRPLHGKSPYSPTQQPGSPTYPPRPQGYPQLYYSYGLPPNLAPVNPHSVSPTARPAYPPPRTAPGAVYPPPRLHIPHSTSPSTLSPDSLTSSASTPLSDLPSSPISRYEGQASGHTGVRDSTYGSLSCSSSEDIEKDLKNKLQVSGMSSSTESIPKSNNLSPYTHHGHSDTHLDNPTNRGYNSDASYSNGESSQTSHSNANYRYSHSDSSVNNLPVAKRRSIDSLDSYSSDECDSLRASTVNSDQSSLRPTSIVELRPRDLSPGRANRNSCATLLQLPGPGDGLKRVTNHRASLTLVNEESALGMYRETAKKTNDPRIQLEFAKYLIFSSTTFGDPNGKDGNPSLKKLLDEAIFWIKRLQKSGQPEAMYIYATWLENGMYGFPQNLDKALALYKSSSKLGFIKSTFKVGYFCEKKKGYSKAVQFYLKAASGGSVSANYRLGLAYLHGEMKLKQNLNQAMLYLARAAKEADRECPDGAYLYGLILAGDYKLVDVSSLHFDLDMAQENIRKAADLGYSPALHRLGACYEFNELGFPSDPSKSITYYREGAEKGDPECQMGLSGWYASGAEGILEQNDDLAYSWCFQATSKGLPKAEFAMGYYYEIGVGVPADPQLANEWYVKAAAHGSLEAQRRLEGGSTNAPTKGEFETLKRKQKRERSDCIIS
ncbi:HCP-like protein [Basidiobolus meristosporus CBS 931.73]|uniref:HCP-like protein n=1 Tax=Basidiobolus meristosporus CBS 931.73 TaxID=1314790 RepID=A0A1Y1Y019_9FUNG|nr:HCP-like protein [Basidiobolus meristosporus CBS 931.73]|eukprot:ORX91245.1 HCP-like protein [Basidiobolus meristosporus CBS 931.73]